MNDNAFAVLLDKIAAAIAQTASVEKIILFGSRARGDHNPRSDIDIAVIAPNIDQREWLDLCERVEEVDTLLMIDVIRFDTAPDELRQNILREGKVFYERH